MHANILFCAFFRSRNYIGRPFRATKKLFFYLFHQIAYIIIQFKTISW